MLLLTAGLVPTTKTMTTMFASTRHRLTTAAACMAGWRDVAALRVSCARMPARSNAGTMPSRIGTHQPNTNTRASLKPITGHRFQERHNGYRNSFGVQEDAPST